MQTVFSALQPFDACFYVKKGPIRLNFQAQFLGEIAGENQLVGTLEYFLGRGQSKVIPPRLIGAEIQDSDSTQKISLATVESLRYDYKFGLQANQFLSQLLLLTNELLAGIYKTDPLEPKRQFLARAYARLVDDMQRLAEQGGIKQLKAVIQEKKQLPIYCEGVVLNLENELATIPLPEKPSLDFLERFEKGSCICRKGDPASNMYVLLEGRVGVSVDGQYLGTISKSGEAFGELGLFMRSLRTADLYVEEGSALYALDKEKMQLFHSTHPQFLSSIASTLAQRIEANLKRFEKLKGLSQNPMVSRASLRKGRQELSDLLHQLEGLRKQVNSSDFDWLWQRHLQRQGIQED